MVDRLATLLFAKITKIQYKVPLLRFLLDVLLKYTGYCQTVLPSILIIASKPLEETDFSVENENIHYAWQMLNNFDLTLWLTSIALMLPKTISFSLLLSNTPMILIVIFMLIEEDKGLEFLFYKTYNEGLPLQMEENKLIFFEKNQWHIFDLPEKTLEKLNEIFSRFSSQNEMQVLVKPKFL